MVSDFVIRFLKINTVLVSEEIKFDRSKHTQLPGTGIGF